MNYPLHVLYDHSILWNDRFVVLGRCLNELSCCSIGKDQGFDLFNDRSIGLKGGFYALDCCLNELSRRSIGKDRPFDPLNYNSIV